MSRLLWEKFKPHFDESWHLKMQKWIESKECYDIYQELKKSGTSIYPFAKDLWNAFRWTNYNKLKCIIIGQSPYHTHSNYTPDADGLCFSASLTQRITPSLDVLYTALEDDLDIRKIERQPDWHYLAFQDVLLLNLSLTIEKGNKDSFDRHEMLWRPFIQYLFENVLDTVTGVPVLIFGKPAEEQIVPYLHKTQPYKCILHPAFFARKSIPMEHKNCFSWTNKILKENNGEEIHWNYDDYLSNDLPF